METMGEKLQKMGFTFDKKDLNDTFKEACKDEEFKRCIENLNFNEEVLKKHTSILKECVEEKKHCSICPSILECKNKTTTKLKKKQDIKQDIKPDWFDKEIEEEESDPEKIRKLEEMLRELK